MVLIRLETVQLVAQLLAQVTDVHVDAAIEGRQFAAQHFLNQIFSLDYLTRIAQQNFEQVVFDSGEFNYFPRAADIRVLLSISMSPTRMVSRAEVVDSTGWARRKNGTNSSNQLTGVKWLWKIIVGADFETNDAVHIVASCRSTSKPEYENAL
jgi:hypothetical protein